MQEKLFANFTRNPFYYLLIIVDDKLVSQGRFFDMFSKLIIDWQLQDLKTLELKFWPKFIIFIIFQQNTW